MKILVRMPNWLGDVIMSTAFIRELKQKNKDDQIDVIIKPELTGLIDNLPEISRIWTFSKKEYKGFKGLLRFGRKIRKEVRYDHYYSLPDSFSAALIGMVAGCNRRTGYKTDFRDLLLTNGYKKPTGLHRSEEYLYLLGSPLTDWKNKLLIPAPDADFTLPDGRFILFNPHSEAFSRRIPLNKSVEIINTILESTFHHVVITGTGKDQEYTDTLINKCNTKERIVNLAGKTSLKELVYICSNAETVLTTDSGIAHVANALGKHVIVLFGAGNENNTAPFNDENSTILRVDGLKCAPCVSNHCRFQLPECIVQINQSEIRNALLNVISK